MGGKETAALFRGEHHNSDMYDDHRPFTSSSTIKTHNTAFRTLAPSWCCRSLHLNTVPHGLTGAATDQYQSPQLHAYWTPTYTDVF